MSKILALSGSLRNGSTNTALLLTAKALGGASVQIEIYDGLAELPFFNPDLDHEHPPTAVQRFRQELAESSALLISTPEYAHGIPGLLKNALDWLVSDPRFVGKRIGLVYASASDASFARESLLEILKTMSAQVIPEAIVTVDGSRSKVSPEGKVLEPAVTEQLVAAIRALSG